MLKLKNLNKKKIMNMKKKSKKEKFLEEEIKNLQKKIKKKIKKEKYLEKLLLMAVRKKAKKEIKKKMKKKKVEQEVEIGKVGLVPDLEKEKMQEEMMKIIKLMSNMQNIRMILLNCLINGELILDFMEKIQDIAEFAEILMDLLENMD